ncbi:MAG: hypothetical protein ACI8QZ_001632 [Chlamydiales bacterium]|jgi:hypothetical protein
MNAMFIGLLSLAAALQGARSAPRDHPRDPWVFRSVLDGRARMLTAVLHEQLWVGYDVTSCSLYGAWSGGVTFEGAVYDTVHGPQPSVTGPFLLAPEAGPLETRPAGWGAFRVSDGASLPIELRYRGYRLDHPQGAGLELHYELTLPDGELVVVRERPMALGEDEFPMGRPLPGAMGFRRVFDVQGLPADVKLQLFSGLWSNPQGGFSTLTTAAVDGLTFDSRAPMGQRMLPRVIPEALQREERTPWHLSIGDGVHTLDVVLRSSEPAVQPEQSEGQDR